MATNEAYQKAWIVPLTVGASVAARTPVCVSKLSGVTLTATGSSGTQVASVLRKGVVDVTVDSACDAVTLACASITAAQTLIINGTTWTAHGTVNTWSTRTTSIAGADGADALLVAKALNGGQILTLSGVTAGQTISLLGLTFTAHTSTTTAANREFSISGADAADATELASVLNDATYGIVPLGYIATAGGAAEVLIQPMTLFPTATLPTPAITKVAAGITISTLAPVPNCTATVSSATVTVRSSEVISAVTGSASGATVTVGHSATSVREISAGDSVYWTSPSTLNCKAETGTAFFGRVASSQAMPVSDRKFTMASVTNGTTIIINGIVFTAHTSTTTKSTRNFSIAGTDTQDGDELCSIINDPIYGLVGFTATNSTGTITLAYSGDIAITGTARIAGTVTVAPGSRKVRVKLGY
jgi:hypothetical protein